MSTNRHSRKCGFELLESRQLLASDLTLLADINSDLSTQGMSVRKLTKLGSEIYFLSDNPTVGEELWKYNSGSPTLVKNINQGSPSANIGPLTVLGDKLIFSATDQEHGNEIWVSDGTETGTKLLQDIAGGGGNSIPSKAHTVGNQSMFFAYGRTIYGRLWKTDGTPEGTTMVKQIESDSQSTFNTNLSTAVVGNKLMFVFDDDVHGAELWESDGTTEGTHIAFEFAEGKDSFQPNHLISLGSLVLMETNQGIYASDGTLTGTIQLSGEPLSLARARVFQNKVYFTDNANSLWVSDGTILGTSMVKTLEGSIRNIDVTSLGLVIRVADSFPYSIVTSDGTSDGTTQLLNANSRHYQTWNVFPVTIGFFFASQGPDGSGLYYSNGTTEGTRFVKAFAFPIINGGEDSVFVDGKLFLPVYQDQADRLWSTDGTEAGTKSVDEPRLQTQSSIPIDQVSIGDVAYVLSATRVSPDRSVQLWRTDGTPDGTTRLLDDSILPTDIRKFENQLAFFTANPQYERSVGRKVERLWTTDGSLSGTKVVTEFTDPADTLFVVDALQVSGRLYFWLNRTIQQTVTGELWTTDGTPQGTQRIATLPDPVTPLSTTPIMTPIANGLVFFKTTHSDELGVQTQSLWRTDGSPAGTFEIQAFAQYDYPDLIGTIGNTLYFSSVTNDVFSICQTDGTELGTIKTIDAIDDFERAIVFQNRIIYTTGSGLWSHDPATGGPGTLLASVVIRKDIGPNFTKVGDKLFFTAETSQELWVTDGSAAGTFGIRNINTSGAGSMPQELKNINGTLYFSAIDSVHGRELWRSNGTEASTELVADATGDAGDGVPIPFHAGTRVLVVANTNEYGREIYAVEKPAFNLSLLGDTIDENNTVDAVVGNLRLANFTGLGLAYGIVENVLDNGKFKILGNQLVARESFNFEAKSSYQVRIQARSAFEMLGEKDFVISIGNINEPPVIELSGSDIAENSLAGTSIGNLSAIDPDANSSYVFSLVEGVGELDSAEFQLVNGVLKSRRSFDFETTPNKHVVVKATEQAGDAYLRTFTIQVKNVNEAPSTISLDSNTVAENLPSSSTIGSFSGIDVDSNVLQYALVPGAGATDNSEFTLENGFLKSAASFDFESKSVYSIRVKASDPEGLFQESVFAIQVLNRNEAPIDLRLTSNSIVENSSVGTVIGDLTGTDPDQGDTLTFSLTSGTEAPDNAFFEVQNGKLQNANKPDFETKSSYLIKLRVSDHEGLSFDKTFTISVGNVNEGPVTGGPDQAIVDRHYSTLLSVTDNDSSREGILDPETVVLVRQPIHGQAVLLGNGKIEYRPNGTYVGNDSFEYRVSDKDGLTSNPVLVSLDVLASFHQHPLNSLDADLDVEVTPLDVLKLINDVNANGVRTLPQRFALTGPYLDVDGDGGVGPLDILIVINYLNRKSGASAEGEGIENSVETHDFVFQMIDWDIVMQRNTKTNVVRRASLR